MDALVLSILLFNTVGIAVIVLRTAIAACQTDRRPARDWAPLNTDAELPAGNPAPSGAHDAVAELPHAA